MFERGNGQRSDHDTFETVIASIARRWDSSGLLVDILSGLVMGLEAKRHR